MPIVRVEMLSGRSQETKQQIAQEITDVMVRHTGAQAAHIYVMFDEVSPQDWAVAGKFFAPANAVQTEDKS